ncbi:MAG: hypothetical protein GX111_03785 [Clostridiales bacterium]|nr:hypothetical protein [Clostridiales bacterium]
MKKLNEEKSPLHWKTSYIGGFHFFRLFCYKIDWFFTKLVSINIVSSDPKRLADFYRDVSDADINKDYGGPHRIEIWSGKRDESTTCIAANYDEGFIPQTYNACQGFEFRITDADAEYKRIRDLGVEVKEPPKDLPWRCCYFNIKDPDGNGIDIVTPI